MSSRLKKSVFFKAVSICLALTFATYNISFAATDTGTNKPDVKGAEERLSVDDIAIAIDAGTIKSKYAGSTDKVIVHIQDAHCNYEAQDNINRMLDQLASECGMKMISVEGAEGVVDTAWFRAFPDAEIRKEVATYFMKKGEITGAEFYSINSDYDGIIFGAETKDYYIKNLKAFTDVYPYKEAIEKYFTGVSAIATRLKSMVYPPKLKELDSKIRAFDDKEMELSDYAAYLYKTSSEEGIKAEDFANFKKLIQTLEYEEKIDFDIVDNERSQYIDALSKKLDKERMTELVTWSVRFKKGHIKAVEFYTYLRNLAKEHELDIVHDYPNLFYYYIYTKLYDGIDNEGLFKEISAIERQLKEKLFTDETERKLDKYSDMLDMFIDLVNIELTNEDYELFQAYQKEFSLEDALGFVSSLCSRYNLNCTLESVPVQISENLPKMVDFYEIAMRRDKALIDNTLSRMKKEGKDRCVLIAGGFHTKGMQRLLEEKGISYVVVTPKITKDVETPYIKVLTNQRTSLEDIITDSAAIPGAGIVPSSSEITRPKDDLLSPPAKIFYTIPLLINNPEELQAFSEKIGAVEGRTLLDATADTYEDIDSILIRRWLMRVKEAAPREAWQKVDWKLLMGAYLKQYEESAREAGIEIKEGFRVTEAVLTEEALAAISDEFKEIFAKAVEEAKEGTTRTPGTQHGSRTDFTGSLTLHQAKAIDAAIEALIREQDTGASKKVLYRKIQHDGTGGTFYVMDDETFDKYLAQFHAPHHIVCVPGTHGSRKNYETSGDFNAVEKNYYIRKSVFDKLTPEERNVFANHELMHIRIALREKKVTEDDLSKYNYSEEEYVNAQRGCDIRPIMIRLGDVLYMESLLMKDTVYGDMAGEHVQGRREELADAIRSRLDDKLPDLKEDFEKEVKEIYTRRANIDRMQGMLKDPDYSGYDVIIVSSSTKSEAEAQQKALEEAFRFVQTKNEDLGRKVCILSVADEAAGGQIIGQFNTWRKARQAFTEWARRPENKDVKIDDLDTLFQCKKDPDKKAKIAFYHNGGKGERFSPATQGLNLSRADQPLIGHVFDSMGNKIDLNLLLAIVLQTGGIAKSNNGDRLDTFWANQLAFGTIAVDELKRSNYHFDKFVVKLPEDATDKDLHDYGTAILSEDGKIIKFLANKTLTAKNKRTGKYEVVSKYRDQYTELKTAEERNQKGVFDYGSFSMSMEMHYKLMEYWEKYRKIFEIIDQNTQAGIERDIEPAFVRILVPLINGINEMQQMPEGLPAAGELQAITDENVRKDTLREAYQKLIDNMPEVYREALINTYTKEKKDDEGNVIGTVEDPKALDALYETVEFYFMYKDDLFQDPEKVVGCIDLGEKSHWFAYKRLLDMGNEKFLMLADLTAESRNASRTQSLDDSGEVIMQPASDFDRIKAEDARRMRGIKDDVVAEFIAGNRAVRLTAKQVREGWEDTDLGIEVKGSVIQGHTVLLPGSRIINSVVSNSQGKIIATNSYVESVTAPTIEATNSIVLKAVGADPYGPGKANNSIYANKEVVVDAFRPRINDANKGIEDNRFTEGQTRMRAPIGHDPKFNDETVYPDNVYNFADIRAMECVRALNDRLENEVRLKAFVSMLVEQRLAEKGEEKLVGEDRVRIWIIAYINGMLNGVYKTPSRYLDVFGEFGVKNISQAGTELHERDTRKKIAYMKLMLNVAEEYTLESYMKEFNLPETTRASAEKELLDVLANVIMDRYVQKKGGDAEVKKKAKTAKKNLFQWMTEDKFSDYHKVLKYVVINLAQHDEMIAAELFDSFYATVKFGTGGRRGKVGIGPRRINPYMTSLSTQGHCDYIKTKLVKDLLLKKAENEERPLSEKAAIRQAEDIIKNGLDKDQTEFVEKDKEGNPVRTTTIGAKALEVMRERGVVAAYDVRDFVDYYPNPDSMKRYRKAIEDHCSVMKGFSSRRMAEIDGLVYAGNGIKYYLPDEVRSTPWLSYATGHIHEILKDAEDARALGGTVKSSSHNLPDNNGDKFYEEDGGQAPPAESQLVKDKGQQAEKIIYYGDRSDIIPDEEGKINIQAAIDAGLIVVLEAGKGGALTKIDDAYFAAIKSAVPTYGTKKDREATQVAFNPLNGTGDTNLLPVLEGENFTVPTSGTEHKHDFPAAYHNRPNPEVDRSFDAVIRLALREDEKYLRTSGLYEFMAKTGTRSFKVNVPITVDGKKIDIDEVEKKLQKLQVAYITDPDSDRLGLAVKRITVEGRVITVEWLTANDNDESGIILFRYMLEKRFENGELSDPNKVYVLGTTVVSNEAEEWVVRELAEKYQKNIVTLRHPVGFKFTGEIMTDIKKHKPTGIVGRMMKNIPLIFDLPDHPGIKNLAQAVEAGQAEFVMSFEEGEGGVIGSEGSVDKDSGVIGLAVAMLAAEQRAKGKTVYDYLQETYRRFGYAKSYLEPMVLDGVKEQIAIDSIVADYNKLAKDIIDPNVQVEDKDKTFELRTLGQVKIKSAMRYRDAYPTTIGTEIEALDMILFTLEDIKVKIKDQSGKLVTITVEDAKILVRASGTEPKIKIWVGVPLGKCEEGVSVEDFEQRQNLINQLNREILDAVLLEAYDKTKLVYYNEGKPYKVTEAGTSHSNVSERLQLLRLDFNVALGKKLGNYFPLVSKVRTAANEIIANGGEGIREAINKFSKLENPDLKALESPDLIEDSFKIHLKYRLKQEIDASSPVELGHLYKVGVRAVILFGKEKGFEILDAVIKDLEAETPKAEYQNILKLARQATSNISNWIGGMEETPEAERPKTRTPGIEMVSETPYPAIPDLEWVLDAIRRGEMPILYISPYAKLKPWGVKRGTRTIGEYWFGAQPGKESSEVIRYAQGKIVKVPLDRIVANVANEVLGEAAVKMFGEKMPLNKILTADKPLSLQVHPDKDESWLFLSEGEIILGFKDSALRKYGTEENLKRAYQAKVDELEDARNAMLNALLYEGYSEENIRAESLDMVDEITTEFADKYGQYARAYERIYRELDEEFHNHIMTKRGDIYSLPRGTMHALIKGVVVEPQVPGVTYGIADIQPIKRDMNEREKAVPTVNPAFKGETGLEIVSETRGVKVERWPGGFEEKGLEVHTVTFDREASYRVDRPGSFDVLLVVQGHAEIQYLDENGNIRRAVIPNVAQREDLESVSIPLVTGKIKSFEIIADRDTVVIDTFTPIPEISKVTMELGAEIEGTKEHESEVKLVFADYPAVTATFDEGYLIGSLKTPEIIAGRAHTLLVQEGAVRIEGLNGEVMAELEEGKALELPENYTDYNIIKTSDKNAVVKIDYARTKEERDFYMVLEMLMKHGDEIPLDKKIHLYLPREIFADGELDEVGSLKWIQDQLRRNLGENITIRPYQSHSGLKSLTTMALDQEAVNVLIATERNLQSDDIKDPKVDNFIGNMRVLAVPDKAVEFNEGLSSNPELVAVALLATAVTRETINNTEDVSSATADLVRFMREVSSRKELIKREDLYYILPYKELEALGDEAIPFEDIREELKKGLGTWLESLVNKLLIDMRMKPFDPREQLNQRRKVMWSV